MLFAFMLKDRPGASDLRQHLRPAHKTYLADAQDQIAFAGPLVADDGVTMTGSLLVIDFPSRESADEWLAQEPFYRAGVFASSQVQAFLNLWPQKVGFPS